MLPDSDIHPASFSKCKGGNMRDRKDEWLEYLVTIAILLTLICVARIGLDYAGVFAWLRGPASTVLNDERAG